MVHGTWKEYQFGIFRERGKLVNYHEVLKGYLDVETPEVRAILRGILQKGRL